MKKNNVVDGRNWLRSVKAVAMVITTGLSLAGLNVSAQSPASGSLDPAFNPLLGPGYASVVYATAVQADGKILIGGDFSTVNGANRNYFARLNADGTLDSSFSASADAGYVYALAAQKDGKILVGGDFYTINGAGWHCFARLNSDGTPDSTFTQFGGASGRVLAIAVQGDQKVVIGGSFSMVNGQSRPNIARLNTDGSLDMGFQPNVDGSVAALAIRPDGKILIGGDFTFVNNGRRQRLAQINADGSLDSSFKSADMDDTVYAIALQTNAQAVVGGWFTSVNGAYLNYLVRLNADGSRDTTFNVTPSGVVYSLAIQFNGKILAGGRFTTINNETHKNLVRINTNGTVDSSFDTGIGPDYTVRSVQVQTDGMILFGGEFKAVNLQSRTFLARVYGDAPPPPPQPPATQIWPAVEIGWQSEANNSYQLQWSSEAAPTYWHDLGQPIPGNGALMSVFDSAHNSPRRFYRVIRLQ